MRILLIRHGETQHNADRIALGRRDVPLNERGLAAAQSIARAYANGAHEIAAIYSSPLQRAVATATPLADALSLSISTTSGVLGCVPGPIGLRSSTTPSAWMDSTKSIKAFVPTTLTYSSTPGYILRKPRPSVCSGKMLLVAE